MADRFQNIKYIEKLKCKTLILHGKKDKLIPYT
jgi:dipeptidyl aminopeptidase/acylaminoacyl peptidase